MIILQSRHCLSSASAPTTSCLRFFPPVRTLVSRLTLNSHVAPQKRMYRVLPPSVVGTAGSNDTPRTGSCAYVNRVGRLALSSFPQTGNCRVSTSYICRVLSGKARSRTEGCMGSKASAWAARWNEGRTQWC